MSLDDIHAVDDLSQITMRALIDRLRRSTTAEQLIYRETELDEMWRLADIALAEAERKRGADRERLRRIKDAVMRAHDLVGVDMQPRAAADILRALNL
jgi:hypothetical protein